MEAIKALLIVKERLGWGKSVINDIMLPIINIPLIEYILRILDKCFINEFAIFGNLTNTTKRLLKNYKKISILKDYNQISSFINKTTLILPGNLIPEINLASMLNFHQKHGNRFTMTMPLEKDNNIICVIEPETLLIHPKIIKVIEENDLDYLWHSEIQPIIYEAEGNIYYINSITDYYKINIQWLKGSRANDFFIGKEGFWVGENTQIHKSAYLLPPILVGNNCVIEKNSYIIGPTIIGDNVQISEGTSISESIIINNTTIESNITLDKVIVYKDRNLLIKNIF